MNQNVYTRSAISRTNQLYSSSGAIVTDDVSPAEEMAKNFGRTTVTGTDRTTVTNDGQLLEGFIESKAEYKAASVYPLSRCAHAKRGQAAADRSSISKTFTRTSPPKVKSPCQAENPAGESPEVRAVREVCESHAIKIVRQSPPEEMLRIATAQGLSVKGLIEFIAWKGERAETSSFIARALPEDTRRFLKTASKRGLNVDLLMLPAADSGESSQDRSISKVPEASDPETVQMPREDSDSEWDKVRGLLKGKISAASYENWLEKTRQVAIEGRELIVEVPDQATKSWVSDQYSGMVHEALTVLELQVDRVSWRVKETT